VQPFRPGHGQPSARSLPNHAFACSSVAAHHPGAAASHERTVARTGQWHGAAACLIFGAPGCVLARRQLAPSHKASCGGQWTVDSGQWTVDRLLNDASTPGWAAAQGGRYLRFALAALGLGLRGGRLRRTLASTSPASRSERPRLRRPLTSSDVSIGRSCSSSAKCSALSSPAACAARGRSSVDGLQLQRLPHARLPYCLVCCGLQQCRPRHTVWNQATPGAPSGGPAASWGKHLQRPPSRSIFSARPRWLRPPHAPKTPTSTATCSCCSCAHRATWEGAAQTRAA
jgi:hypothetical protein